MPPGFSKFKKKKKVLFSWKHSLYVMASFSNKAWQPITIHSSHSSNGKCYVWNGILALCILCSRQSVFVYHLKMYVKQHAWCYRKHFKLYYGTLMSHDLMHSFNWEGDIPNLESDWPSALKCGGNYWKGKKTNKKNIETFNAEWL